MSDWKNKLKEITHVAENYVDNITLNVKKKMGWLGPVIILPYHGFGNSQKAFMKGRVLEDEKIRQPDQISNPLQNIWTLYKRYESDEIPGLRVKATFYNQSKEIISDEEGYFEVDFDIHDEKLKSENWHEIHFELLDQVSPKDQLEAKGKIMIPGTQSTFGVISDVDDTILISNATNFLKKASVMLLNNASTRKPFEGIAAFYRALQRGNSNNDFNPIFYVSSSEWNLFDLLKNFCEIHEIPRGPFLLRDVGVSENKFIKSGHGEHKLDKIKRIMGIYPDLPFILIGDSGQKDPEIYRKVAMGKPDRIKGIYIRDVTSPERDKEVKAIAEEVGKSGIEMKLVKDSLEAAEHAADNSLIDPKALEEIRKDRDKDKEAPSDWKQFLGLD